jgi:hypothetical protein
MVLLEENRRRNQILDRYYDPITGQGSTLERQSFELSDLSAKLYLPVSMLNVPWIQQLGESKSMFDYVARYRKTSLELIRSKTPIEDIQRKFLNERLDHDFEYWAAVGITILNKDTFDYVPFVLRLAQQKLLFALEGMRLSNVPIRIVLLKARQWGGSTLVQFYMMWIQNRHRKNWHMAVCAQDDNAAKNISEMYAHAARNYPKPMGTITLKNYAKSTKNRICLETGGIIGVGSVNNPDQFRSYNRAMSHLSEVGVWQDTPKRSAINLITALKESVPDQPLTVVVEESTAKGLNYFYESWLKAIKGETRYKGVFVGWWEIDRCRIPVDNPEEFYKSLTEYERSCWDLGATLEGIAWYRNHKADKGYTDWMMYQENPSTPEEAFQSTGQKVIAPAYITALRTDNNDPDFVGEVYADSRIGKDSLKNIRFEKMVNGNLKIWKMPDKAKFKNRYVVIVDIGGRTDRADNSVIRVIDRMGMTTSEGFIEAILTWKGHTDQDLLAWKAVQIATMYENALLVIESNSLKKEEEGDHFLTILNQIKDFYNNIYIRNDEEKVGNDFIPKYGFQTTSKTKSLAVNSFNGAARERHLRLTNEDNGYYLIENDKEVCDEASWFETKPNGSQGAIQGKHDDLFITTAIGCHIAINIMPMPEMIVDMYEKKGVFRRSESSF